MDVRRVRAWDFLTGLAGVALLVSLFLPWYDGPASETVTGWEAFGVIDVVLALAALLAVSLPVLATVQRTAAVPQAATAFIVLVALPAAILALIRLLNLPGDAAGREAGVWIGAASAVGIVVFAWRSMGDKRFPGAMRPKIEVETIAAPAPDGERRDLAS